MSETGATVGQIRLKLNVDTSGVQKSLDQTKEKCRGLGDRIRNVFSRKAPEEFAKAVEGSTSGLKRMSSVMGGIIKLGFAAFLAMIGKSLMDIGGKCVSLASNLTEVENVVSTAFPNMYSYVDAFAKKARTQYGLSETMAKNYIGTFGAMARAFGFTEKQAAAMSTTLTGLAGDVASFYNITQDEAYNKLKSVFTGETESLKQLGIVMTQTALDTYALENGFGRTTAQMSEAEKVALRYAFVQSKLSMAQGDVAKTTNSWANQTRLLKVQMQTLGSMVGAVIIKVLLPLVKALNWILDKLISIGEFVAEFLGKNTQSNAKKAVADLSDIGFAADDISIGMDDATKGTNKLTQAIKKASRSVMGFDKINKLAAKESSATTGTVPKVPSASKSTKTGAQIPIDTSMIGGLGDIVEEETEGAAGKNWKEKIADTWEGVKGGIVKGWEGLRDGILKGWELVKGGVVKGWKVIKGGLVKGWEGVKTGLVKGWNGIKGGLAKAWNGTKTVAGKVWSGVKTVSVKAWNGMKTAAGKVWNGVKTVTTKAWGGIKKTAGKVWNGTKTVAAKAWNGMKTTAGKVWGGVKKTAVNSWTATKKSFGKFTTGFKNSWTSLKKKVTPIADKVTTSVGKMKEKWEGIKSKAVELAADVKDQAKEKIDDLKEKWDGINDRTAELVAEAKEKVAGAVDKLKTGWDSIQSRGAELVLSAKQTAADVASWWAERAGNWKDKTASLAHKAADAVNTIGTWCKNRTDNWIGKGANLWHTATNAAKDIAGWCSERTGSWIGKGANLWHTAWCSERTGSWIGKGANLWHTATNAAKDIAGWCSERTGQWVGKGQNLWHTATDKVETIKSWWDEKTKGWTGKSANLSFEAKGVKPSNGKGATKSVADVWKEKTKAWKNKESKLSFKASATVDSSEKASWFKKASEAIKEKLGSVKAVVPVSGAVDESTNKNGKGWLDTLRSNLQSKLNKTSVSINVDPEVEKPQTAVTTNWAYKAKNTLQRAFNGFKPTAGVELNAKTTAQNLQAAANKVIGQVKPSKKIDVTMALTTKAASLRSWMNTNIKPKINSAFQNLGIRNAITGFAQGGFLRKNTPQLAIVGDNRHQGEYIAPEKKMEAMANQAAANAAGAGNAEVISLLRQLLAAVQSVDTNVYLDGKNIADNTIRRINNHTRATGVCEIIM